MSKKLETKPRTSFGTLYDEKFWQEGGKLNYNVFQRYKKTQGSIVLITAAVPLIAAVVAVITAVAIIAAAVTTVVAVSQCSCLIKSPISVNVKPFLTHPTKFLFVRQIMNTMKRHAPENM